METGAQNEGSAWIHKIQDHIEGVRRGAQQNRVETSLRKMVFDRKSGPHRFSVPAQENRSGAGETKWGFRAPFLCLTAGPPEARYFRDPGPDSPETVIARITAANLGISY